MLEGLFALILVVGILMAGLRRPKLLMRGFTIQSLAIALVCLHLGFTTGESEYYYLGLMTIVIKVILITYIMDKSIKDLKRNVKIEPILSGQWLYILMSVGIAISYALLRGFPNSFLKAGIVLMLVGGILLISRKKAISQMIGFLTMENGLVLFEISMIKMSFIIEAGLILEVLILALIMGMMVFNINKTFDSLNTDNLSSLKE